jgi:Ribbon-helix-helix protein, copG family
MKDNHLTLRLPADLARALARWARDHEIPKSQAVREAVARYLTSPAGPAEPPRRLTARALAARWASLPRLTREEAADLAADIAAGRDALPPVGVPWE